ncbi:MULTISPECIES: WG repeat-containing protein [Nostocales]|uniref:WG repeat-containing protein n=2 Tax=Nostocales TaxID=1161 RepID=A0ABW8WMY3_9CYAN
MNKIGKIVVPPKFDATIPISEGLAVVQIVENNRRKLG